MYCKLWYINFKLNFFECSDCTLFSWILIIFLDSVALVSNFSPLHTFRHPQSSWQNIMILTGFDNYIPHIFWATRDSGTSWDRDDIFVPNSLWIFSFFFFSFFFIVPLWFCSVSLWSCGTSNCLQYLTAVNFSACLMWRIMNFCLFALFQCKTYSTLNDAGYQISSLIALSSPIFYFYGLSSCLCEMMWSGQCVAVTHCSMQGKRRGNSLLK